MGIFSYIKIGFVVALVITVGVLVWTYQDIKIQLQNEKALKDAAEANLKVAELTINIFRKMENSHEAIENAPNDAVADYLRTGVWPNRPDNKKGNGLSSPSGAISAPGKPGGG